MVSQETASQQGAGWAHRARNMYERFGIRLEPEPVVV
jgi:hypothetical protein